MDIKDLLNAMQNELGTEPKTMVLLSQIHEQSVHEHAANKQFAMSGEHIPLKYKLLMSIAVAGALGFDNCMEIYTKLARKNGATVDEIRETIMLTRFVKGTTVLNTATNAMQILLKEEQAESDN